jgi:hypothetical protein
MRIVSSSNLSPAEVSGGADSHAPESGAMTASSLAFDMSSVALSINFCLHASIIGRSQVFCFSAASPNGSVAPLKPDQANLAAIAGLSLAGFR